jgi:imidazolonepropionase-like amidohydrolase
MRTTLRSGITTVRDAGGADLGIKVARERGLIAGPDLIISITLLSQTGGHGDTWHICGDRIPGTIDPHPGRPHNIVDGPDEMRRRVRELIRAGADVIKVCTSGGNMSPRDDPRHSQFRDDELSVCVAEASAAGLSVMAHATSADGIKAAVRNGIRSVEHGGYLDDESINMMVESGTFLVPTLSATQGVVRAAEAGMNIPDYALAKYRDFVGVKVASFRRALEAGVKIAMGTDSGAIPHGQNLLEIHEMAQAGMPPADALIASTRVAAELLGIADDRGTIEQGKRADIVVVDGEPLDVSGMPARVRTVIQAGNRV